ncbi:MAG: DUF1080 domain-containing protein [Planctomycetes bacterium]|nr:DUF1080 domain-containing protein [Planctomycetota bacterium]
MRGVVACAILALAAAGAAAPAAPRPKDNSLCMVCHLGLEKEEIAAKHAEADILCADCHGPSFDHMHDEMLMTTPDILYGRTQVDGMCGKCHDDPHEDAAKVKAFLESWRGRDRPNGRVITDRSICTDCHGLHTLKEKTGGGEVGQTAPEMAPIFDGESLAGWKPAGGATWEVRNGRIAGTPSPDPAGGDLWSADPRGDYKLAVTFRTEGPIAAGIWVRGTDADRGPRIEIIERREPSAFPGSVRAGKELILVNVREDLFDREGWNTIAAEVRGDRIQVWLNGEEIGAARIRGPARGRIGFHLEGGAARAGSAISIREVLIQPIEPAK